MVVYQAWAILDLQAGMQGVSRTTEFCFFRAIECEVRSSRTRRPSSYGNSVCGGGEGERDKQHKSELADHRYTHGQHLSLIHNIELIIAQEV